MVDCLDGQLRPNDVLVLVMGLTGAGKSTFIEKLTGEDAGIGHSLVSATNCIGLHCFNSGIRRVFLVETPGFDDTRRSDAEVFKEIAFFLCQAYTRGVDIGGIIYVHRITDNRVSGSAIRSLNLVKSLCGPEAARLAMLMTTMWDLVPSEGRQHLKASQAEQEFTTTEEFWGSMRNLGSRSYRWMGTRASALSIMTILLWQFDNIGPVTLQIQKEMVDERKDLDDTTAGSELLKHYGMAWQRLHQELTALRALYEQALDDQDSATARTLNDQSLELENRLAVVETAEKDLRDNLEPFFTAKTQEYEKLFHNVQDEIVEILHQVEELRSDLSTLERFVKQDDALEIEQRLSGEGTRAAIELPAIESSDTRTQEKQHQGERSGPSFLPRKGSRAKIRTIEKALDKCKKRELVKRNILPILGMLGGVAAIAAGAATMHLPIVTAGMSLIGTYGMKLDLSRNRKRGRKVAREEKEGSWDIDDSDG